MSNQGSTESDPTLLGYIHFPSGEGGPGDDGIKEDIKTRGMMEPQSFRSRPEVIRTPPPEQENHVRMRQINGRRNK